MSEQNMDTTPIEEVVMDDFFGEETVPDTVAETIEEVAAAETENDEEEIVVEEAAKGKEPSAELQEQLLSISKELKQLRDENKELRGLAEKPPAAKDGEEKELTDADLLAIMREHKDDEGVLLRVFKHVSEKAAEKAANEKAEKVVKDQTYSQWAGKMTQVSEAVLEKESRFSDQRFKGAVDKIVNEFSLVGHPAADMIGAAVVTYAQLLADEKAEASEKKRVDRAAGVKTAVTPRGDTGKVAVGKNGAAKLTPEQLRFCRDQGIDPVQYAKFVK